MKRYLAVKENTGMFLSKDEQLDEVLSCGYDILEIEDDKPDKIIATPEKGFLEPRPVLKKSEKMIQQAGLKQTNTEGA